MYKNFNLTDAERQEIFEMHQDAGYKQSINENVTKETEKTEAKETNEAKEVLKTMFDKFK
jgi:hypothetical protein